MEAFEEKESYLNAVKSQIRWNRAKEVVSEELEQHIEDQKRFFMENGMDEEESERKAVLEMGDPVDTGMQLDRIHRPKIAWGIFIWIFLLSAAGIFAMSTMTGYSMAYSPDYYVRKQILFMGIGLFFLIFIYFADYTVLGKHPIGIFFVWMGFVLLDLLLFSPEINGTKIASIPLMLLFIPAYAGVLYHYRNQGYFGALKCVFLSFFPMGIALCIPSFLSFAKLFLSVLILSSLMAGKGWFGIQKKRMLLLLWLPVILGGIVLAKLFGTGGAYYFNRFEVLLNPEKYADGMGYSMVMIRGFLSNLKAFGASGYPGTGWELGMCQGNLETDRMLLHIFVQFGWVAGIAVTLGILGFILYLFCLARRQKSILGYLTGNACALVIALECIFYIFSNLGLANFAAGYLPFMSYGGRAMVINFCIAGLMLSVHRNTSIVKKEGIRKYSRKKFVTWENRRLTFYF